MRDYTIQTATTGEHTRWSEPVIIPEAWMQSALCAETDPDAFFPDKGESTAAAKKICERCDVPRECLAYAMRTEQRFGVWGNLDQKERRKLRVKARKEAGS